MFKVQSFRVGKEGRRREGKREGKGKRGKKVQRKRKKKTPLDIKPDKVIILSKERITQLDIQGTIFIVSEKKKKSTLKNTFLII